jgi:pyridoxal phosphate enzyme (YggS family)
VTDLQLRYEAVLQRVKSAASKAGRNVEDICLVVVTKNHPVQLVADLFSLGARDFGENRDQEASAKSNELKAILSENPPTYHWHFIGQLQSKKVKSVLEYASVIHSLDRESLLQALIKEVQRRRITEPEFEVQVFIQVNLTDNEQRGGVNESDLLDFADRVVSCEGLKLLGVMAVGTLENDPEADFARVREISQALVAKHPEANQISAGMSEDFETAIAFGATHLRVGTAITGKRDYSL